MTKLPQHTHCKWRVWNRSQLQEGSDLVLLLHCWSRPFSNFVAKILGVNTSLILSNTQLYFMHYSLDVTWCYAKCGSTVVQSLPRERGHNLILLNQHVWNGFGSRYNFCQCTSAFPPTFLFMSDSAELTSLISLQTPAVLGTMIPENFWHNLHQHSITF